MDNQNFKIFTLVERPDLLKKMEELHAKGWARFMLFDDVAAQYFGELPKQFPQLQFLLVNEHDEAIACGNAVPFSWDGTKNNLPEGWDDVLRRGVEENKQGIILNTVSAIAVVINPDFRGSNISGYMVRRMKDLVRDKGFNQMVAPVRSALKHKYPIIPMQSYAYWKNSEGLPFDPWIRVHSRTNADIIAVANESMIIKGSVKIGKIGQE
ncbi:GNAT family N-acetyltransferase [Neobacillus sp. D3-1R]|uniref:GNAT family N-acetyltransferase n=1 Tax=Neobacillus sp. D3-1R TaxID=3445778 RepID=UPI003FA0612A